jgi:hypothetical protein
MRTALAALIAATLLGVSAVAQQPGSPGEGSGLGPGQSPPPSTTKTLEPPQPPQGTACDPSFGGKYLELIRQIAIPEDAQQYGRCHDYGAWAGTEYKGHTGLPPRAFWTYSAPNWYIWAKRGDTAAQAGCPDPTFSGKYSGELRRLEIPQDRGRYGACKDYGPWTGSEYQGHTNLPNGYWVYSYPHWIIYANRGGQPKQ